MKKWLLDSQKLLSAQIVTGKLPHATLISGVEGSGKFELAQWLLNILLCQQPFLPNKSIASSEVAQACQQCKTCLLNKSGSYPDHKALKPEKTTIGIDEIRLANQFIEKTPHIGEYKTILIEQAEKMTIAASNALLKTLEEPSGKSVIILLSTDTNRLLPTIISRCRLITIAPPVGRELQEHIGEVDVSSFDNLSHLPELTDETLKASYMQFTQAFELLILQKKPETELLVLIKDNIHALRWFEKTIANLLRQQYLSDDYEFNDTQRNENNDKMSKIYKLIQLSSKQSKLYPQMNNQMMLEQLVMEISHVATS